MRQIFKIRSSINLPWGSHEVTQKFRPDRFSCFDVYWIQINKQTNRQTDKLRERDRKRKIFLFYDYEF